MIKRISGLTRLYLNIYAYKCVIITKKEARNLRGMGGVGLRKENREMT